MQNETNSFSIIENKMNNNKYINLSNYMDTLLNNFKFLSCNDIYNIKTKLLEICIESAKKIHLFKALLSYKDATYYLNHIQINKNKKIYNINDLIQIKLWYDDINEYFIEYYSNSILYYKNIINKKMKKEIINPKIMCIYSNIYYEKYKIYSLDLFKKYEKEYLNSIINKILNYEPNIIFLTGNISKEGQELFKDNSIIFILNVNLYNMIQIAMKTGAQIINSIDNIEKYSKSILGECKRFKIINNPYTYLNNNKNKYTKLYLTKEHIHHIQNGFYLLLENCKKFYGGAIYIKGLNKNNLKQLKNVMKEILLYSYHTIRLNYILNEWKINYSYDFNNYKFMSNHIKVTKCILRKIKSNTKTNSIKNLFTLCDSPISYSVNFYSSNDISLGNFLENQLKNSQNCQSSKCNVQTNEHFTTFIHGHKKLSIFLIKNDTIEVNKIISMKNDYYDKYENKSNDKLKETTSRIQMWRICNRCNQVYYCNKSINSRLWNYSFYLFLKLFLLNVQRFSCSKIKENQNCNVIKTYQDNCVLEDSCIYFDVNSCNHDKIVKIRVLSLGNVHNKLWKMHKNSNIKKAKKSFVRYQPFKFKKYEDRMKVKVNELKEFASEIYKQYLCTIEKIYSLFNDCLLEVIGFRGNPNITKKQKFINTNSEVYADILQNILEIKYNIKNISERFFKKITYYENKIINFPIISKIHDFLQQDRYIWVYSLERFLFLTLSSWNKMLQTIQQKIVQIKTSFMNFERDNTITNFVTDLMELPKYTFHTNIQNKYDNMVSILSPRKNICNSFSEKNMDKATVRSGIGTEMKEEINAIDSLTSQMLDQNEEIHNTCIDSSLKYEDSNFSINNCLHKIVESVDLLMKTYSNSIIEKNNYWSHLNLSTGIFDLTTPVIEKDPVTIISYSLRSFYYFNEIVRYYDKILKKESNISIKLFEINDIHYKNKQFIQFVLSILYGSNDKDLLSLYENTLFDLLNYRIPTTIKYKFGEITYNEPIIDLTESDYDSFQIDPFEKIYKNIDNKEMNDNNGNICFSCTIFFSVQFQVLRRLFYGSDIHYSESLTSSILWLAANNGGKSGATFLKSIDNRFIIKYINKTEQQCFLNFSLDYFNYMAINYKEEKPSILAKILGLYKVSYYNKLKNENFDQFLIVLENVLYLENILSLNNTKSNDDSIIFDLKGTNRKKEIIRNDKKDESNIDDIYSDLNMILPDGNFIEYINGHPLSIENETYEYFRKAILNDIEFLTLVNSIDYSLVISFNIDKNKSNESFVVGIVDYLRQYDIIKRIESVSKSVGMLAGQEAPTIIGPLQYSKRFINAMNKYFVSSFDQENMI